MKGIIVVDVPKTCWDCLAYSDDGECKANDIKHINHPLAEKPDWCPIKPLPEKMEVCGKYPQPDGIVPSYKIGFNKCIDEILKGENR